MTVDLQELVFTHLAHETDTVESCRHLYVTHVEGASLEQRNQIIQELPKLESQVTSLQTASTFDSL